MSCTIPITVGSFVTYKTSSGILQNFVVSEMKGKGDSDLEKWSGVDSIYVCKASAVVGVEPPRHVATAADSSTTQLGSTTVATRETGRNRKANQFLGGAGGVTFVPDTQPDRAKPAE